MNLQSASPIVFLVALALCHATAFAQDNPVLLRIHSPCTKCIEELEGDFQAGKGTVILQSKLDPFIASTGGGACPSAAAIVVLQTARKLIGLEPLPNPHEAFIESVNNDHDLLAGRLSNFTFCKLISFYGRYLPNAEIEISAMSAPNSPNAVDGNTWKAGELPMLGLAENEIKVLSYTVTNPLGNVLGRHFVILKSVDGNTVHVVDPNYLGKQRSYEIVLDAERANRVFLKASRGAEGYTYELNTVFEITVKASKPNRIPTERTNVSEVVPKIDDLANRLKHEGKLRSPIDWRREGSKFGLPSLDLPSEFGGANWPAQKMIEVFRAAGRHDLNLRDVVGAAHARALLRSKNAEVRDVIQQVADGNGYVAITITEPSVGSDFAAMESTCVRVPGGYLLNGVKRYNARLEQASHVIVFTRANPEAKGLNVFLLPLPAEGAYIESFGAHGLIGNSYGGLTLQNVFVPESHLIGKEGEGASIFFEHFRYWRLMQVATAIGTAEQALDQLEDRLLSRNAYGAPIGRFTHLQQPLGQYSTQLKMAHALALEAAKLIDEGKPKEADPLICGLKAEGVEIALDAVDAAVRAFGGEGYSDRVDLGDRLRDLNGLRIADGTTDVMRSAVVKYRNEDLWNMAIESK